MEEMGHVNDTTPLLQKVENPDENGQSSSSKCMVRGMKALATIALFAALIRCAILAIFTIRNFMVSDHNTVPRNASHFFDLMHSTIQSIHVIEYIALLYGITRSLRVLIEEKDHYNKIDKIKDLFTCSRLCVCIMILAVGGIAITVISAFVPLVLLSMWQNDILTESATEPLYLIILYVIISYFSHACHSLIRVFMVYVTMVVRSAWLYEEEKTPSESAKKNFADLINNYTTNGEFVAKLHAIFRQWFVMQWAVYFIKITEDFSIALNSLMTEKYLHTPKEEHKLCFVVTHLVFDLILFLIPYVCASLFNNYHDKFRERLQEKQKVIFTGKDNVWMHECAHLIPENPKYVFIPSFCGFNIPLSSPGYNLTITFSLIAFIVSVTTAL